MASNYAKRMSRLSARIFGEVVRPADKQSMKVVKIFEGMPPHLDPNIVNYYPRLVELKQLTDGVRYHGLYTDEFMDYKEELERRRAAKGKVKKVPYHVQKRLAREAEENSKTVSEESKKQQKANIRNL